MNKTRVAASIIGIFAGLGGGVFHGIGEVLQGSVAPNGMMIQAWPAMQATAGEPAMTIVPNFLLTGILAIILGIIVTVWAAAFLERKNGGLVLILLSIIMLLFGGGIIPPIFGVLAGIIGTRIKPD
ncbi:MAG: hypothetical protein KKF16_00440 [Euryarchaeota archaeon]|nr:hypothetical protein [Euryarchaeota archaeon]MBU4547927.1 hypothetical protein [Euryarchaeota archaeon]MBV1728679.1 hypothetical protein [Methanobacterium sp.]MBV1755906.1 hypothetical protein [Methanobacterium sp.]